MDGYDESGWWMARIEPLPSEAAYTLLSPGPSSSMDAARWAHQARRFFELELSLTPSKAYPGGGFPRVDVAEVEIVGAQGRGRVRVLTVPREQAPDLLLAAQRAAAAIGGAGMDVLVARSARVWQVARAPLAGDDADAALRVAAVLASLLLAPVLTPEGEIFGVKGARERLSGR